MAYKQPLRQTEGLVRSLVRLMDVNLRVPDYSTISRRGTGLTLPTRSCVESHGPIHLVVDSTGLKIFGEGKWLENKHETKPTHKSWRKLHPGLDLVSGDIVCSDLTKDDVGDPTALPDLLDQIDVGVTRFIADGPMMEARPATCSRTGSVSTSRLSLRLARTRLRAPTPLSIQPCVRRTLPL
jgi:Transposase DDE domain